MNDQNIAINCGTDSLATNCKLFLSVLYMLFITNNIYEEWERKGEGEREIIINGYKMRSYSIDVDDDNL